MKTPIPHPDSLQPTGKQPIILFALSLIFALSILLPDKGLAQDKEAYVVVSSDSTTLTFYYDDQMSRRKDENNNGVHGITETSSEHGFPLWINVKYDEGSSSYIPWVENPYKKVFFDDSFKNARPTSCSFWLNYCTELTEIEGLENLNTEEVKDMYNMFGNCSKLTTLDLKDFDTGLVTDMGFMFCNCSSLTTLNVSSFNTEKVDNMNCMFLNCSSLTSLDVTKFDTKSVIGMNAMFGICSSLTTLDVSNFNTAKVIDMTDMFNSCDNLTVLDLRSFVTNENTDIRDMFSYDVSLTTIIVSPDKWTNVKTSSFENTNTFPENPFINTPQLIGDKGTVYSDDSGLSYAHIDEGASNPGYLTTESYKIFYDLDGGTWADGVNPPTSFALDLKNNIQIPTPKKSGMKFVGWTGTLASGLSSETPTKDVQITPDKLGNRIYTAHWEEKDINITIPDKITFPASPLNNEAVCEGSEKSVTLSLALPDDEVVAKYVLSIPNVLDNDIAVTPSADDSELEIVIDIPQNQAPGAYQGSLNLYFLQNAPPKEYHFTVEIAVARNVLLHLYNDVIFVDNHSGLYGKNGSYHWYRNDQEIPNANNQYLYAQNMSGKYKAGMLTSDGVTVYSCPIDEGDGIAKSHKNPVKTYPNPAVANQEFSIEIIDFDPEASYTIKISNSNGVIVKEIHEATQISTIALPRGVYSGALISGGRKKGFKLIVR
ncbi:MAG: BspA family leucine-rich repeat surface protein [Bacteroidales bacterium]|nr:BspA family leucine-rich repeat surface protein [Bacteroidales bacterium]